MRGAGQGIGVRRALPAAALTTVVLALPFAAVAVTIGTTPPTTTHTVNNGAGNQTDPHISGSLVSYTSDADGTHRIRYHDLATGSDNVVPNSGESDFLSDVSGTRIVFTRLGDASSIYLFDAAIGSTPVELAPLSDANRRNPAIGGSTVAWQDFGFHASLLTPEIVVHEIAGGTTTRLTNDALLDRNAAVSPDGNTVAWVKCQTTGTGCDIWKAVKSGGSWSANAMTGASGEESVPDTNGEIVAYASTRSGETDIYWQPASGGTEQQLSLSATQGNPNVSGGLIAFDSRDASGTSDVWVYDVATDTAYRLTSTTANETLNDISVSPSGLVRVVYQSDETGDFNIYAQSFVVPSGTYVVNSTGDGTDTNTGDGVCQDATGKCTLRAAIQQANAHTGADTINFNIPPSGTKTVSPSSELPTITDPVTIDGTTQPGSQSPGIELDGSGITPSPPLLLNGLTISAGSTTVRGLAINRFPGAGIFLQGVGGNVIEDNYIGTDLTGTIDRGNANDGIIVFGVSNNRIGGTTAAVRNVISGNDGDGITLVGAATGNVVEGNYIGTTATGGAALGNSDNGVFGGGSGSGVTGNTIRGNVISGNSDNGVRLNGAGTTGNLVQGNSIGTDSTGTVDLGNGQEGVFLDGGTSGNTIVGNVISGNQLDGILLSAAGSGNEIKGNKIGTTAAGTGDLGNTHNGIRIVGGSGTIVGGTAAGAANVIFGNDANGVAVLASTGNAIQRNSIFANTGLGIDLGLDGVTANDPADTDTGANELQNFPVLTSAVTAGGVTTIQGTLNSTPATAFTIEFFANGACDPSNHGEGQSFRGSTTVTTGPTGDASFVFVATSPIAAGEFGTATATDSAGTSEFSKCLEVKTAAQAITDLSGAVTGLALHQGTENSLLAKLNAALAALAAGDTNTACNNLDAFINEVQAQSGKKIPAPDAAALIELAEDIKTALGC